MNPMTHRLWALALAGAFIVGSVVGRHIERSRPILVQLQRHVSKGETCRLGDAYLDISGEAVAITGTGPALFYCQADGTWEIPPDPPCPAGRVCEPGTGRLIPHSN